MGCYICNRCGGMFNSHEVVCFEDPDNRLELICDDCHTDEDEEILEERKNHGTPNRSSNRTKRNR